jgi:hypothetical protein
MDAKNRELAIAKVLKTFEESLCCTAEQAKTILAAAEGFKFNGTSVHDAKSYLTQLMWKLQLNPTSISVDKVTDYLNERSIITDIPPDAQKLLFNPGFPFLAGLTYRSETTASQVPQEDFVKSRIHDRMNDIPKKVPDFFYVEQFMPRNFYTMVSNSFVESYLDNGIQVKARHPIHLWLNATAASHAFTTGMDIGHAGAAHNKQSDGTLLAINSDVLVRDPSVFTPLHKHTKIVCMQYLRDVPASSLTVKSSPN